MTVAGYDAGNPSGHPLEFSICIATRNRATLLGPLMTRLSRLDGARFEIVVVDDGSTDETPGVLASLSQMASFTLRFASIPHSGRGAALNRAFDLAQGRFIFLLDDDDAIPDGTLLDILSTWNDIPALEQPHFCGVCGLAEDENGKVIGDRFPHDSEDSDFFTMRMIRNVRGDKREVFLRRALGNWRFPVLPGETRVSTNLLWFQLATRYRARFVNEVWLSKSYRADGISAHGLRNKVQSARLSALYNEVTLRQYPKMPVWLRLRFVLGYARYAAHAAVPVQERCKVLGGGLRGTLTRWLGEGAALSDRRRMASEVPQLKASEIES